MNSLFSGSANLDTDLAFIEQFQKVAGRPLEACSARILQVINDPDYSGDRPRIGCLVPNISFPRGRSRCSFRESGPSQADDFTTAEEARRQYDVSK
jgi:hypothetical protein